MAGRGLQNKEGLLNTATPSSTTSAWIHCAFRENLHVQSDPPLAGPTLDIPTLMGSVVKRLCICLFLCFQSAQAFGDANCSDLQATVCLRPGDNTCWPHSMPYASDQSNGGGRIGGSINKLLSTTPFGHLVEVHTFTGLDASGKDYAFPSFLAKPTTPCSQVGPAQLHGSCLDLLSWLMVEQSLSVGRPP